jgi:DNA helicase-4
MMPLMNRYEKILRDNDEIDFDDMIGKALEYVENGSFKPHWKYIMVDEFQDISDPRARLVQALKEKSNNCSLFCVGDDWQAIYRFTGSDISFTTGFSEYFGVTKFTKLKKTFRFNNSIAEVSSQFVLKNPFQTKKSITTLSKVKKPAVSILRESNKVVAGDDKELNLLLRKLTKQPDSNNSPYLLGRYMQVDKVLQAINKLDRKVSVLILGRYRKYTIPTPEEMKLHKEKFPNLELIKRTIHTSKGKEEDYVIIMGLRSGKYGFPSEKTTNPLLDALLPTPEDFEFAEERRLFYVAITRARKRSYLVADMNTSSRFVNELIEGDYEIELNEFHITNEQRIIHTFHCAECETGVMQRRINTKEKTTFYGCSHYSLCKYTEDGCLKCGGRMNHLNDTNGKYKICSDCDYWIPICASCGGDMRIKENKDNGNQFWACSHYYGPKDALSCGYTKGLSAVKPPTDYEKTTEKPSKPQVSNKKGSITKAEFEEIWNDKKFTDRQDAYAYASKLARERKSTVNVIEGDGFWSVVLKK